MSKSREMDTLTDQAAPGGYVYAEPREEFYRFMDAANVDLKAFTERFYWKMMDKPPTPQATLTRARRIAIAFALRSSSAIQRRRRRLWLPTGSELTRA